MPNEISGNHYNFFQSAVLICVFIGFFCVIVGFVFVVISFKQEKHNRIWASYNKYQLLHLQQIYEFLASGGKILETKFEHLSLEQPWHFHLLNSKGKSETIKQGWREILIHSEDFRGLKKFSGLFEKAEFNEKNWEWKKVENAI